MIVSLAASPNSCKVISFSRNSSGPREIIKVTVTESEEDSVPATADETQLHTGACINIYSILTQNP